MMLSVCLVESLESWRSWRDKLVWVTVEVLRNSGLALRDKEDWVHLLLIPSLPSLLTVFKINKQREENLTSRSSQLYFFFDLTSLYNLYNLQLRVSI